MKNFEKSKIPRLFELMQEKGIKGADITRDLRISSGNISDWKNGKSAPASGVLITLADYLGTTAEYLSGETEEKEKALPEKEEPNAAAKRLMELYNELNREGQEKLLDYADDLVTSGKYATFKIYRAAHSDTNNPAEIKNVGKEFVKALEEAPETNEKF